MSDDTIQQLRAKFCQIADSIQYDNIEHQSQTIHEGADCATTEYWSSTKDGQLVDDFYTIRYAQKDKTVVTEINFQKGDPQKVGITGATNESLLAILIHRLTKLNEALPCKENKDALLCLRDAEVSLMQRKVRMAAIKSAMESVHRDLFGMVTDTVCKKRLIHCHI